MLPKEYRLKKKDDFQRVYKKGRFFSLGGITINFIDNSEKTSRVGFVVGKNYSKSSVERNKARRILRECIAKILSRTTSGKDIILGIRKLAPQEKITSKKILALVEEIFERNKLIKK